MVTSQPFEYIIFSLIIINTITLGMKFYGQPEAYTQALDILNMVACHCPVECAHSLLLAL